MARLQSAQWGQKDSRPTDAHWTDFMGYENGTSTSVQFCIRGHWERFSFNVFEGELGILNQPWQCEICQDVWGSYPSTCLWMHFWNWQVFSEYGGIAGIWKYSRAPFSTRIRWMNMLIEQSNQYEKKYLVQWVWLLGLIIIQNNHSH